MTSEFGKLIKHWRIRKGDINQEELAKALGCSHANLSNIVTGKRPAQLDLILKCQAYFNLNNDETIELFTAALHSYRPIISWFEGERKEWLIKVIVTLLLMPEPRSFDPIKHQVADSIEIIEAYLKQYKELRNLEKLTHLDSKEP